MNYLVSLPARPLKKAFPSIKQDSGNGYFFSLSMACTAASTAPGFHGNSFFDPTAEKQYGTKQHKDMTKLASLDL